MEGDPTAPPAEGVGLVAALAKRAGTLSLLIQERTHFKITSAAKSKKKSSPFESTSLET